MSKFGLLALCFCLALGQGPDDGGYRSIDSDTAGGPVFSWVDISGGGTRIELGDDDNKGPFGLGFPFSFYRELADSIRVCSNGWLSFTSSSHQYHHYEIPNSREPNSLIAPLWADLDPSSRVGPHRRRADSAGGAVCYWADTVEKRFVVSWNDVPFHGQDSGLSFQAILDSSGEVLLQYLRVPGAESVSVGIEDDSGKAGLEYWRDGRPEQNRLHDSLAVRFYRLRNDVCPLEIGRPFEQELAGTSIIPSVLVWNVGLERSSFPLTMRVAGYEHQVMVSDLGSLERRLVSFPAFHLEADTYRFEFSVPEDEYPGNDTIRRLATASYAAELRYDDGVPDTWILRIGSPNADWGIAVRYTCPYSRLRLLGARVFVLDTMALARLLVCEGETIPDIDNPLFEAESVAAQVPESWIDVPSDTVVSIEGNLWFVAFWPRGGTGPRIGEDRSLPIDSASYFGSPTVRWIPHAQGDLMARIKIDSRTGIQEPEGRAVQEVELVPNPFRRRLAVRRRGPCAGGVPGRICDVTGRVVRCFEIGKEGEWVWNGLDEAGRRVTAGAYFVEVDRAGLRQRAKVLLSR